MSLFKNFFSQTRKPEGFLGKIMLSTMNSGHAKMADWGMTFSSFGYYGQIWFNRAYTYECAVEEMPVGYADGLMAVSPFWALPVAVAIGIILSVLISNVTAKLFKLEK